jgi:hypothetical protein
MPTQEIIVVPDSDDAARALRPSVPDGILQALGPDTFLQSADNLRLYVRRSLWEALQAGRALTAGAERGLWR